MERPGIARRDGRTDPVGPGADSPCPRLLVL